MTGPLPRDQFPPGLDRGECVPLSIEEFWHAFSTFMASQAGRLPHDPNFPTMIQDARTGEATPLEDTPFNRAWFAAGKEFDDHAKRISFYWRLAEVLPIAFDRKYDKYRNRENGSLHMALLMAVARVTGSVRTTRKALRTAFDAEFRHHLATLVDLGGLAMRQ
jgi:hypothetical protein